MRKPDSKTLILSALGVFLLVVLVFQQELKQSQFQAAEASLTDVRNIEQLQAQFNQDKSLPRLILLVSPT